MVTLIARRQHFVLFSLSQGSRWRAIRAKKSPCEGWLRFLVGQKRSSRRRPRIFSTCHLWKCRYHAHVYWNLSYPLLSILKVIFLESNPLRFIEILLSFIGGFVYCLYIVYARLKIKLFVFVFRKQTTMAPFW